VLDAGRSKLLGSGKYGGEYSSTQCGFQCVVWAAAAILWQKPTAPVFKSWGSPNLQSEGCGNAFFSHAHNVMLPTTTFMQLRSRLDDYQNRNGLMFAGGWTDWFDSQEAALMSAIKVAQMLQPPGKDQQVSQPPSAYDPSVITGRVKSWIEMVLHYAPEPHKSSLVELVKHLAE